MNKSKNAIIEDILLFLKNNVRLVYQYTIYKLKEDTLKPYHITFYIIKETLINRTVTIAVHDSRYMDVITDVIPIKKGYKKEVLKRICLITGDVYLSSFGDNFDEREYRDILNSISATNEILFPIIQKELNPTDDEFLKIKKGIIYTMIFACMYYYSDSVSNNFVIDAIRYSADKCETILSTKYNNLRIVNTYLQTLTDIQSSKPYDLQSY